MVEVVGTVHKAEVQVKVADNQGELKELLKEYMDVVSEIEKLQKVAKVLKERIKEKVEDVVKVEVPEYGIVKASWKVQVRESIDRKKMKELIPESLLAQFVTPKEIKLFEIRTVKK